MTALPQHRMTVDEFLVWAEGRDGRYDLYNGIIYAMTPERARHAEVKFAVQTALAAGIRKAGVNCHMMPDGMTVRIDEWTAHEPDALVYCGERLPPSAIEVPNPVIVVEVASPTTRRLDAALKLGTYFRLPSVMHYLLIDPDEPLVIHHARAAEDLIESRILRDGTLRLHPPGIEVAVAQFYGSGA